jgi:hypothetical protein
MTFTFSNLYFFVCVYVVNFSPDQINKCMVNSPRWPIAFVCTVFPLVARLLQSLKRYYDCGSMSHLINVRPLRFRLKTPYLISASTYFNRQGNMGVALSVIYSTSCGDSIVSSSCPFPLQTDGKAHALFADSEYRTMFVLWCLFAVCYSLYALLWVRFISRSLNLGVMQTISLF